MVKESESMVKVKVIFYKKKESENIKFIVKSKLKQLPKHRVTKTKFEDKRFKHKNVKLHLRT